MGAVSARRVGAQPPNSQDLGVCPGWAMPSLCQLLGAVPPGNKMLIPARSYVASRWIFTLADLQETAAVCSRPL